MTMRWTLLPAVACLAIGLPIAGLAAETGKLQVEEQFKDTRVGFALKDDVSNVTVVVAGPNRFRAKAFSAKGAPVLELRKFGKVSDGLYKYEITAASRDKISLVNEKLNNGRGLKARKSVSRGVSTSGSFRIVKGRIAAEDPTPESKRESDRDVSK